jgi:hypothetical protein
MTWTPIGSPSGRSIGMAVDGKGRRWIRPDEARAIDAMDGVVEQLVGGNPAPLQSPRNFTDRGIVPFGGGSASTVAEPDRVRIFDFLTRRLPSLS